MLRIEYDSVVAFHPYRTHQPWDLGGVKVLQVDGVNCGGDEAGPIARELGRLEGRLREECLAQGIPAHPDNHCGYTVVVEAAFGRATRLQLRFSDGSLYVWVMP